MNFIELAEAIQNVKTKLTGFVGEFAFQGIARLYLNDDYHIMSNIVLKAHNGTTEIDEIIVSKYGIFVIEIKTYKGWIFGDKLSPKWTQSLYNEKHTFQNPLRQNYKHIKSLQSLLKLPDNKFISLIVFSGEVKFKTEMPDNVVRGAEDYINFILKHQTVLFSDNEVSEAVKKISDNCLSEEEHLENIKKLKEQYAKADKNDPPQCPKCGKKMVLRTSTKGYYNGKDFWGCCDYPRCKSIVNIQSNQKNETLKDLEKAFSYFFERGKT